MKVARWISAAGAVATLAACGTSTPTAQVHTAASTSAPAQSDLGTVAGTFTMEGGPIKPDGTQLPPRPLTGTLFFAAGHRGVVAVRVAKNGRFSAKLLAGNYVVAGRSPSFLEELASGAKVEEQCAQPTSVTVIAGRTVRMSVVCFVP